MVFLCLWGTLSQVDRSLCTRPWFRPLQSPHSGKKENTNQQIKDPLKMYLWWPVNFVKGPAFAQMPSLIYIFSSENVYMYMYVCTYVYIYVRIYVCMYMYFLLPFTWGCGTWCCSSSILDTILRSRKRYCIILYIHVHVRTYSVSLCTSIYMYVRIYMTCRYIHVRTCIYTPHLMSAQSRVQYKIFTRRNQRWLRTLGDASIIILCTCTCIYTYLFIVTFMKFLFLRSVCQ